MKLEINSNEYEIIIVEENDERLLIDDYIHTGKIDYIKQEIYIQNGLKPHVLRYTLIHELTHAVIGSYGLMQIVWNDEIIADFIANNMCLIGNLYNEILEKLISGELKYDQTGN